MGVFRIRRIPVRLPEGSGEHALEALVEPDDLGGRAGDAECFG